MSNIKNGGPAFPSGWKELKYPKNGGPITSELHQPANKGMTLRDYFAAKALKTRLWNVRPYDTRSEIAKECYAMADAMLAEREKVNE